MPLLSQALSEQRLFVRIPALHHRSNLDASPRMASNFRQAPRVSRMRTLGGPSVWLEFSPLAHLTGAINLGKPQNPPRAPPLPQHPTTPIFL